MIKQNLYDKLIEYGKSPAYPFHMPGHKRQRMHMEDPYRFDLTEIDGFDNLHDASEILQWEQERAAKLYGSEETHFMVNGSSGGILSAISGVIHRGDRVLVARNCHKSVYHALEINGLRPVYLWPKMDSSLGIYKGVSKDEVEKYLEQYVDIKAVIFTSPTYEGLLSDVRGICEAAHKRGIPCIVDEAHGAHLRWIGIPDAVACGADVVIQSLHKTLPTLTQTALIHLNGSLILKERIRKMLSVFQTSSPSYVLMASISQCMSWLEQEGKSAFRCYEDRMTAFRKSMEKLNHIYLYTPEKVYDWGKLVIATENTSIHGRILYDCLRLQDNLQMEMVSSEYVLAMSTVCDSNEGLKRLEQALIRIDRECGEKERKKNLFEKEYFHVPLRGMEMEEAYNREMVYVPLEEAKGRISGEYLYLYPPGIPIVVPGEVFDGAVIRQLMMYIEKGLDVHGGYDKEKGYVKVILHHG